MSKTKIVNFVFLMTLELFLSRVVIKPEFDLVYVMSKLGRYCIISYLLYEVFECKTATRDAKTS